MGIGFHAVKLNRNAADGLIDKTPTDIAGINGRHGQRQSPTISFWGITATLDS
jgi:hypothetical protein